MAKFEEIDEARRLLGLGEIATLKEIKGAYRRLAFRHHPDKHGGDARAENEELMKRLNRAYKLITEYCHAYKYSFSVEDVARTYPFDEYLRKYYRGWFEDNE
jgi:DnaJ-class molecular chaperone